MATEGPGSTLQAIGREVPDFKLEDLTGNARSLSTELAGHKGAVVVFWSCVCSHCLRYDEYLNTFRSRHPEVALLAIGSRPQESRDQLCAAARDRRLSFPILIDPGGRVARQWYTEQTPRAFLVASDMRLLYRGAIDNFQFP